MKDDPGVIESVTKPLEDPSLTVTLDVAEVECAWVHARHVLDPPRGWRTITASGRLRGPSSRQSQAGCQKAGSSPTDYSAVPYPSRYHNIFFAYRGAALSDVQLTAGRQLEDNLTRALVVTLAEVSEPARYRFLGDICGIEDAGAASRVAPDLQLQPLPVEGRDQARAEVLLGISPLGGIEPGTLEVDHGGSRADGLAVFDSHALVVIEAKAIGRCHGAQLARHAHAWGLASPTPQGPPPSWPMRTWQDLADWARHSAAQESRAVGQFLLLQFADYLDLAQVTTRSAVALAPSAKVERDVPAPAWMDDLAAGVDLDRVAEICAMHYGDPKSPHYVAGESGTEFVDCRGDSRRVAAAYREAREKVPPVLLQRGGDVITPRRALCILYGPDRYEASIAEPETSKRAAKLIGTGADRAVLLGMLAWAWDRPGTRPSYLRQIIAATWSRAPVLSPAAPELHEAFGTRLIAMLRDSDGEPGQ